MENKLNYAIFLLLIVYGIMALSAYFVEKPVTNDQNNDGVVNLTDFSIALARANDIAEEIRNQNPKPNVIEDVYPPVPLPYEPMLKQ